jgi:hypothetical protein
MPKKDHEHDHQHQAVPSDPALRTKALESLLVEKGLVDPAALDALVDAYENRIGPRNGAQVVARAWMDPAYKERLLNDGGQAIAELGYLGAQGTLGRRRKHFKNPQPCRVHSLLLLSLAGSWPAACLVQVGAVSVSRGDRSTRCSA